MYVRQVAFGFEPFAAIARALLGQQHVEHLVRFVLGFDGQLHEPARFGRHGRFAQLHRVHFTQTFEAGDDGLRARILRRDAIDDALTFGGIERVVHLFAGIDSIQRRHRDIHVTCEHQRTEVTQEQCTEQCRNVCAVGIRVRENADPVVAQALEIVGAGIDADGDGDVVHFL